MRSRLEAYIGGRWVDRSAAARLPVVDPTTEQVVAEFAAGTAADVDAAVAAAGEAREARAALGFARRADHLAAIADGLERRRQDIVELIVTEVGTPRAAAESQQFGLAVHAFREMAAVARGFEPEEQVANSTVERVPLGVAGLITPWNYPLYQIALKVAPALAAGCTVVLKPSEVAPLNAFALADVVHEAGLPAGVFNLVPGTGVEVGEAIARHPGIDMVSFTGSVRAGRRVATLAGETLKKVTLELGGKGGSVLLEGGDLDAAVAHAVRSCFSNAGQTCAALSRLIVPRARLAEVEAAARAAAASYVVGDPRDPATQIGPVVSQVQRDRVDALVRGAMADGAKTVLGPADRTLPARGFFVAPTVFSEVTPDMTVAQEEVFGPVLSILPVADETAAVAAANATRYGLTAAVWARDLAAARAVAGRIRAGSIFLNGGKFNASAPFGGFKESGFGRERGRFGIDEYLTLKAYHA